jgi:hypothetical protein
MAEYAPCALIDAEVHTAKTSTNSKNYISSLDVRKEWSEFT